MKPAAKLIATAIAAASVAACGGGGGGGGGGAPTPPPTSLVTFTQFSAIAPNQTVIMNGTAVTASGNQTSTSITSMEPFQSGAGEARLAYDGARALSGISVSTPQSSATFDRNTSGHTVSCSGAVCEGNNPTALGFAFNAFDPTLAWNYQTFGYWVSDTTPSTYSLGAISVGNPTAGNAIPTTGSASFVGVASGFLFDQSGTPFITVAAVGATANFSTQSIAFSTSGTRLLPAEGGALSSPGHDLTGTFTYAPGVNALSSTNLRTQNNALSGQGSARFYGPAAEEIGGVYSLSGTGLSRMFGGFGGKR